MKAVEELELWVRRESDKNHSVQKQCDLMCVKTVELAERLDELQVEATCNHCGEYHGREVCRALLAENGRYRETLTQIRDATHKNALMLRAMADRALSVSTLQSADNDSA